ncbi:transcription termination factor 4, mitochondrial-like [Argonauta hians]
MPAPNLLRFLSAARDIGPALLSKSLGSVPAERYACRHHHTTNTKLVSLIPFQQNLPGFLGCLWYQQQQQQQPQRHVVTQATDNDDNDAAATEMVSGIKEKASTIDKMVLSIPDATVCRYISILANLKMPADKIKVFLGDNPEVLRIPLDNWQTVLDTLHNNGIKKQPLLKTLKNYPLILGENPKKLSRIFDGLRMLKISDNSLRQIISHQPGIVSLEQNMLLQKARKLQGLFKVDDVIFLIRKSPSILLDDWDTIQEKFHYVFSEMGITQPQMRHSNIFGHSLDHIRTRHLWVSRSGFFKKSKHKEDQDLNPRLGKILDTSDKEFASRFGNMSVRDYRTFRKLLHQEIKEDNHNDDDDYYDSDDDDSDDDDDDDEEEQRK